jgi:hypothetical protein
MTRLVAMLVVALCAARGSLEAQQLGSVRGSVEDVSGAVVAGATVTLVDQAGQTASEVLTDGSGVYAFDKVRPGSYQVRTVVSGFDPIVRAISVRADDDCRAGWCSSGRRHSEVTVGRLVCRVDGCRCLRMRS